MESYLDSSHFDLVSPDGTIEELSFTGPKTVEALISIQNISPNFVGFSLDNKRIMFNLKSTLAQLGINSETLGISLSKKNKTAEIKIKLVPYGKLAEKMLGLIQVGTLIGKLFADDESRKVRDPIYLMRMFGRCDRNGSPLLFLGGPHGRDDLILEKIKDHMIAFLPLKLGTVTYKDTIYGFLPTLALMLKSKKYKIRELLHLHQQQNSHVPRIPEKNDILLVSTEPLHVRTVFAKVASHLLPKGYEHTAASLLQPDTTASGNIYELFGKSKEEIVDIPLEFYTLEPHREYVFFEDRDQLQSSLENPSALFKAFSSSPKPNDLLASVFIVKGKQLEKLTEKDWITREAYKHEFPGLSHPSRQALLVEKYIEQQPSYPFLKAIQEDLITSQGILLTRFLPSPLMKQMLISTYIQRCVKGIYFQKPSRSHDVFFSNEDRTFLFDLAKFGIPSYWVDEISGKILKYVVRPDKEAGMFVPLNLIDAFCKATFFGVYGSNLIEGNFENELKKLLQGLLDLRPQTEHPLLNNETPLALVTGGGPGAMEVGNRVAKSLNILSCANIVDFRSKSRVINEQAINPHIDAKMTYRIDRLVERQAEFYLDFPIFLQGGIGMYFEYTLEEVRRKVGANPPTPILLFGDPSYWHKQVTSRFQCNLESGTIKGSEWISNCFYCIQTAQQGLKIYEQYFNGILSIGPEGKFYEDGFCIVDQNP
jgi:predicted Rossmann-fold nucleotide-binding protein